jgi:DNA helicase-2/ATP-dependent DNA helicase PcrA
VKALIKLGSGFDNVKKFIKFIETINENEEECIQLMTIHKSKGLEFENVFLMDVNDKVLPSSRCADESEEANLFYVAITRAKNNLYIQGNSPYVHKLIDLGYGHNGEHNRVDE